MALEQKKGRPVLRPACFAAKNNTMVNQAVRSFRKERMAPMPNGSNIKAPATTVVGSGTGT
jgi:hypothetical protein